MPFHRTLLHQLKEHRSMLRSIGKTPPPIKKPPVPAFPWGPERTYSRALVGMMDHLQKIAKKHLESRLPGIVAEAGMTRTTQDEWVDEATALSDAIWTEFGEDYTPDQITRMAREQGVDVANVNGRDFLKVLAHVFSVDPLISEPWLASHIKSFTKQNVGLINSLPKRALGDMQAIILSNTRQGLRHEEMIPAIMDRFDVSKSWAKFLARDQTAKYNSDLTEVRHREVGIEEYTWWTAMDERVRGRPGGLYPNARPSHWAKQGKIFTYARPPSDTGNPGQDYQCFISSTQINTFSDTRKIFRRWYSGELTTLVTASGKSLSITPNHPVLTMRGWIPAKDLEVGDDLIQAPQKYFRSGSPNIDDPKRSPQAGLVFEKVFNSAKLFFDSMRNSGMPKQFHGDGTNEDIDIVTTDRSLLNGIETNGPKFLKDFLFSDSYVTRNDFCLPNFTQAFCSFVRLNCSFNGIMRRLRQFKPFLSGGLSHSEVIGFGATTELRNTQSLQVPVNGGPVNIKKFSQRQNAGTAKVKAFNFTGKFNAIVGWVMATCLGIKTKRSKFFSQVIVLDSKTLPNFCQSNPALVQCDRLVQKFTGVLKIHVYNLETENGWYSANGLILSNCRCVAIPYFGTFEKSLDSARGPRVSMGHAHHRI